MLSTIQLCKTGIDVCLSLGQAYE